MKGLSKFLSFNWPAFSTGKYFLSIRTSEWKHHETGQLLGTKVEALITDDQTDYGVPELARANLYEKITFKVPHSVIVPPEVEIQPKGNIRATVYGDFRNNLSIVADDIEVIDDKKK